MDIIKEIQKFGIVPVIAIDDVKYAKKLAKALTKGGLGIAEITYRTACAQEAMIKMKEACPEMIIGAGTVLSKEQVDSAIVAGAEFIVSPGLNPEIVQYCQEKKIPIIPGCATPSDMEQALALGLTNVKFFPAEANGGITSIKAMSAPYANLKFMPTGGINETNINEYLDNEKILACGGTWMVPANLIKAEQFDEIERLTKKAVLKMLDLNVEQFDLEKERMILSTKQMNRALYHLDNMNVTFDEVKLCKELKIELIERSL